MNVYGAPTFQCAPSEICMCSRKRILMMNAKTYSMYSKAYMVIYLFSLNTN